MTKGVQKGFHHDCSVTGVDQMEPCQNIRTHHPIYAMLLSGFVLQHVGKGLAESVDAAQPLLITTTL